MAISLKKNHLNNFSLSILTLLLSFGLWHTLSRSSKITAVIPATVYFYNTDNTKITAPETVAISVYGKRSDLKKLLYTAALHIDGKKLKTGVNTVVLTKAMFNIPADCILLNYEPALTITL